MSPYITICYILQYSFLRALYSREVETNNVDNSRIKLNIKVFYRSRTICVAQY